MHLHKARMVEDDRKFYWLWHFGLRSVAFILPIDMDEVCELYIYPSTLFLNEGTTLSESMRIGTFPQCAHVRYHWEDISIVLMEHGIICAPDDDAISTFEDDVLINTSVFTD